MGCFQSKHADSQQGDTTDLAYISAFPNGAPKPAPSRTAAKELEDLQLHQSGDYDDDSESELSESSSDDELFLESQDSKNLPSPSKGGKAASKGTSIRRTNKLNVGMLEGTTFLNNYIVVDTLGRGSFGKVKLCLSIEDDSLYAVKVVDKRLIKQVAKARHLNKRFGNMKAPTSHGKAGPSSATGDHLEDLRREVDIMRALSHPNLVKLYEVIDDKVSGKILMVVEFCEAGTLVSPGQLTPERRMPEAIAQFYFRQMVSGIAYLHENSVIHGDMKPENVLLAGDATVKIADFGQSQFMSGGEDTLRRTLGTPAFLAPEICAGEDYRGRPADVWALGVSLYGFIYGELPFKGDSLMELYEDIADAAVPFPPSVAVSMELQDLLLRTLHKDPEARITAAEMLTHPWVREDDLFTLMPSLFSEEAMMEGGAFGGIGGACLDGGISPRPKLSPGSLNGGDGNVSSPTSVHGSRAASYASSLPISLGGGAGGAGGAPSPADVAAAVFPSLFSMRRGSHSAGSGGKGDGKHSRTAAGDVKEDEHGTGAFTLGPQSSIIDALQYAVNSQAPNKLGTRPSERLHYLSTDSMVRGSLDSDDEEDTEEGAGGSSDRAGQSRSGEKSPAPAMQRKDTGHPESPSSSSSKSSRKNRKDKKMEAVAEAVDSGISRDDIASGASDGHTVEVSKPSSFTMMAKQAQKVQAELLAKQSNTTGGATLTARGPSGALETIGEEESFDLDASSTAPMDLQFSSLMSRPSGSYEIIDAPIGHTDEPPPLPHIEEEGDDVSKNKPSKSLGGFLGKKQTASIPIPTPSGSSGLTEITWTTSGGVQQSSQSLTFGLGSRGDLPIASPFDTIEPSSTATTLNRSSVASSVPSFAADSATIAAAAAAAAAAGGSGHSDVVTSEKKITATAAECEIEEDEENTPSSSLPSTSPPRFNMQNLIQRMSFKGLKGGEPTADTNKQDSESSAPQSTSISPAVSALPSTEVDPAVPPIQWRMYRPGQKLHFQMSSQNRYRTNTVYYIESGMVELRWEASLAVPLTTLLSTMQHPSHKYGTAGTTVTNTTSGSGSISRPNSSNSNAVDMRKIDSVALSTNKVTTLRQGSVRGSTNSKDDEMDRSETMANTLQQAAERAEALMVNATGGSLDNLLLSHRGASQFVGALSMLDPDYFADRWKATAIAQTELVVIQMTRAGLDEFLAQNPLAQVHLRASMARGQAEITKLEALERIADAHRRNRYPKQTAKLQQKNPSWKLADVFGVSLADAAEAVGFGQEEDAAKGKAGDASAQETAGLDVFALVSKLRNDQGTS